MSAVLAPTETPDSTLAAWQAREAQVRALNPGSGLGRPEQFAGRTGMEVFRAILAGEIPTPPISETLDFVLVEAEPERCFRPPYVGPAGWVGVVLDERTDWELVSKLLRDAFLHVAGTRLRARLR